MDNKDLIIIKGLTAQFITELHREEKRLLTELETTTDNKETAQKITALQRIYTTLEAVERLT